MFTWWNHRQPKNGMSARQGRFRPVVECLEERATPATIVNVGETINISQAIGTQKAPAIVINPNNPSQVVCFANIDDITGDNAADDGLFEGWSNDGGQTWNTQYLFTGANNPDAATEFASAAWDRFGNLFVAFQTTSGDVSVAYSLDGGQSFLQQVLTADGLNSEVSIATGPSNRPDLASVWVVWHVDASTTGVFVAPHLESMYAWTGGLGVVSPFRGRFGFPDVVPGSDQANAGPNTISIGPRGQVMVTYQSTNGPPAGPGVLWSNVDPDGFGSAGWGQRRFISNTNVGFARGGTVASPFFANTVIDAAPGVVWNYGPNPFRGRIFFVYVDAPSPTSTDTDVYLRYSDNNGVTWSPRLRVNDGTNNSQFLPSIALDQTTGNVAVSWYDARNSASATISVTSQIFGSVSDDGGASFGNDFMVSPNQINPSAAAPVAGGATANGVGAYCQISFVQGNLQIAWADNSATLLANPDLGTPSRFDIATARVRVAPLVRVRVLFPTRWRLVDAANSVFLGRLTIINNSGTNLRGPFRLTITLPDSSLSFLTPANTKSGNTVTFTINGNLNNRVPLRLLTLLSNPLRLKLPTSLIGYATSLA